MYIFILGSVEGKGIRFPLRVRVLSSVKLPDVRDGN